MEVFEAKRRQGRPSNFIWGTAPQKHSFNIDLSIEVDAKFIEEQGGPEQAVEYINFLVSAANMVFEHEVDAHCKCLTWFVYLHLSRHRFYPMSFALCLISVNVVHIEETGKKTHIASTTVIF